MNLTENETRFIIWFAVGVLTLLGVIVGWILNRGVKQIESIAASLNKIEKDLSVLSNDHINLKQDVVDIKQRVSKLETV
jgi:hypothetical protein